MEKITVATNTGKQVTAPLIAFVIAIISEMPPAQRDKVMQKVANMAMPSPGKHILMPNGGFDHQLLNS